MTKDEHNKIVKKFMFKIRGIAPTEEEIQICWDLVKDMAPKINAEAYEKDVFKQWPQFSDLLTRRIKMNQKARWN